MEPNLLGEARDVAGAVISNFGFDAKAPVPKLSLKNYIYHIIFSLA